MKAVSAALLLLSLAGGVQEAARAASLQISPVSVRLRPGQNAAGIELQNLGDGPIYGQVRVFLWDQKQGDDVLTPTRELVASPPIVQIAARASQTVRLVRTGAGAAGAGEATYRVLIDEVAREDSATGTGVDIRLRYSVPVFVAGAAAMPEALTWRVAKKNGAWLLRVDNGGGLHAQIGTLEFNNRAGVRFVVSKGLFGYVLAGRWREWALPVDAAADLSGVLEVHALVNARPVTAQIAAAGEKAD